MILYLLDHRNWIDDEYYDTKFIGIYSSKSKALSTIEKFSQLPGFRDFKTGFHIEIVKNKSTNKKVQIKEFYEKSFKFLFLLLIISLLFTSCFDGLTYVIPMRKLKVSNKTKGII